MPADASTLPVSRHRGLAALVALGCIAVQFSGSLVSSALALAIWLVLLLVLDREALRALWKPKFWAFSLVLALASGLLLGPRQETGSGSLISLAGLHAGLLMVLRGAFIFGLACWASRAVRGDEVRRAAARMGLPELGAALSSSVSLLPQLSEQLRRLVVRHREDRHRTVGGNLAGARQAAVWLVVEVCRLAEQMAAGEQVPVADAGEQPSEHGEPLVLAVVGGRGSGKTTTVCTLADELARRGLRLDGVVQPARDRGTGSASYRVRELAEGQERLLARRRPAPERGFDFEPETWRWAADCLGRAATADILVADELGLLEAEGKGHMPALIEAKARGRARALLLAVRADCAEAVERRLGRFSEVCSPDLDDEQRQRLVRSLEVAARGPIDLSEGKDVVRK